MPRKGMRRTRRHFVDLQTMALELGISPRRVQQLTCAGILQQLRPGVYWLEGNVTFYEVYLKKFRERKGYTPWAGFHDDYLGGFVRTR
ncbi:MAG: hypothetical protein ACYC37_11190 [Desulfobacteria bacterium]